MAVAQRSDPVDLTVRPLAVGEDAVLGTAPGWGHDVILVDVAAVPAEQVLHAVAELVASAPGVPVGVSSPSGPQLEAAVVAGVALIHINDDQLGADGVAAAGRAATAVLVTVRDPADALVVAGAAAAAGVHPSRLVVELVVSGAVDAPVRALAEAARTEGYRFGAILRPPASLGSQPDAVAGWEIGVLTTLFHLGVATVRGVAPARFHRVRAVVDTLDGLLPADAAGAAVGAEHEADPQGAPS